MFSVEYLNNSVIISAYNIRRINFRYQVSIKKLIVQAMKQSCNRIVLNLVGVRQIDNCALEMLKLMSGITTSLGIKLKLMNLDAELCNQIRSEASEITCCLTSKEEVAELAELIY